MYKDIGSEDKSVKCIDLLADSQSAKVVGREPRLPRSQQSYLGEVALHPTEGEQGVDQTVRCEDKVDGSRHDDQGGGTIDTGGEYEAHRYVQKWLSKKFRSCARLIRLRGCVGFRLTFGCTE